MNNDRPKTSALARDPVLGNPLVGAAKHRFRSCDQGTKAAIEFAVDVFELKQFIESDLIRFSPGRGLIC